MTKFSFVIPAYNGWSNLHALLFDIYKNCSKVHEVLVMDDVSDEESFLGGISWWKSTDLLYAALVIRNDISTTDELFTFACNA